MAQKPLVGIIMGSKSDWETMKLASQILTEFGVAHECKVLSAHRAPDLMVSYAKAAHENGIKVLIAGAGGAAHLPGVAAAQTVIPVLGIPIQTKALGGLDSLLSIVQMPSGVPVGTLGIGDSGASNAAYLALEILGLSDPELQTKLTQFRAAQAKKIEATTVG